MSIICDGIRACDQFVDDHPIGVSVGVTIISGGLGVVGCETAHTVGQIAASFLPAGGSLMYAWCKVFQHCCRSRPAAAAPHTPPVVHAPMGAAAVPLILADEDALG